MLTSKVLEKVWLSYLAISILSCTTIRKLKNNLPMKSFQHFYDLITKTTSTILLQNYSILTLLL